MSYANMDGVPTQTAGTSELLASDWNTYVRDNFDSIKFGHVVCTSSTRPSGIAEGTMIYETDTNKVLVYNGSSWIETNDLDNNGAASAGLNEGYRLHSMLVFTSSSTFSKGSYSWLRAIRVRVQGAGGGGGGRAGSNGGAGGGGGGGYAEIFYTNISALDSSVTVTIGAGGSNSTGSGGTGGTSSFGGSGDAWYTAATGGTGGSNTGAGGDGGAGSGGNFTIEGADGLPGTDNTAIGSGYLSGGGGGCHLGGGGRGLFATTKTDGIAGNSRGGGGGGAVRITNDASGGAGSAGLIIVELYA